MNEYIPDPIEMMESRAEALEEHFIDENHCMECQKKVDYELYCPDPMGCGPALCVECLGYDPAGWGDVIPKKANPKYRYLCGIILAAQEGLRGVLK